MLKHVELVVSEGVLAAVVAPGYIHRMPLLHLETANGAALMLDLLLPNYQQILFMLTKQIEEGADEVLNVLLVVWKIK